MLFNSDISKNIMKKIFFLLLILHIKNSTSAGSGSKFKTEVYSKKNVNQNCSKLIELEILGTPEALVRYKHEFPITITNHKTRLRRRRPPRKPVEQLKTKYGFSAFSYEEPLSYKPSENLHGSHKSVSTFFGSKGKFSNYVGFYKELDPDFTFEDITFSEYEEQPIILNFNGKNKTNKKQSKNRSKEIKSLNKFNQEKTKVMQNSKDSSTLNLEQPIEVLLHEEPPLYKASKYIKAFQKPFENQKTKKDGYFQQQYKVLNPKYYIPHSKYRIPTSEYNEEYETSYNKNRFNFGEPFQINIPHTHNKKRIQIPKKLNRFNYNTDSKKTPLQDTANVDIITKPPLYVQPPDKNYNGYFEELFSTQKNFKNKTSFPNYQQELPLQSDTSLNFNFSKSSYDVPVYEYMPFRLNEEAHDNYPPLTDYHLLIPEPQNSPSKIALTYTVLNSTLIPLGYFNDNLQNFSKLLSHVSNQKYLSHENGDGDIKKNITREREFINRNSNIMSFDNVTNTEDTFQFNYDKVIKQKSEKIDLRNDGKNYPTRSNRVRAHIPKDMFLLSLANKKPSNHKRPLSSDPMKITSYTFNINHNISASIPNVKTDNKSHEQIIMTTSNYKRSEKKVKKNENLNSFSTRISKSHNSEKFNFENLNFGKISDYNENLNEGNQFNLNYNNFEKVNNVAKIEKEHKDIPNLTLIQEPFDFNERKYSEKRQLRYKNHRYN